jgi:ribosomal protein S18 acetylase RimI-like enzyme
MPMNIRQAVQNDFPRMIELSRGFTTSPYSFDPKFQSLSPAFYPAFAQDMIQAGSSISLVMEDEGLVIGYIVFAVNQSLSDVTGKKTANILLLSVEENRRCQGIGKVLVQKAMGLMFTMGVQMITVGTDLTNYSAVQVYLSNGFRYRMSWHIYRRYPKPERFPGPILDEIEPFEAEGLPQFRDYFRRPISLLKERTIDTAKLKNYLTENMIKAILKGSSSALFYHSGEDTAGFINIGRDEIAQKSLKIGRPVYKILDLAVLPPYLGKGIEKALLKDACARFTDAALFEIWIDAENIDLISFAGEAGFSLSYTGVSLHYIRP